MAEANPRVRVQLELDQQTRRTLDKIMERTGAKKVSDVLKQSVRLYDWYTEQTTEGNPILALQKDGTRQQPIVV